ncbi:QacE family quaternary ammonium compound efflux SMR transporter [Burkholderia sp. THE68]|uniref:DMT family transporter n=1 Tax=Burkholderiaceae TaxID=119060 RepID=UPI0013198AE3|nr:MULTISPECIES: multidrug efflux SMR transporter [Burkholderiaceae]BBU30918.1 QacE family quaternary ammonium compound efflux SMR transporter [Burkholderia sp. THE68]BCQ26776.1 multidrug efflux SMR transporter [Caballeronia sp. NK8]
MSQSLGWLLLILSGLLDVAWAVSMKFTQGYTRPGWTVLSIVLLAAFVYLLGKVLTVLPVGSAYAVWTGIGALGTVLLGVVLFGEAVSALRVVGVVLVIAGIAALKQAPA